MADLDPLTCFMVAGVALQGVALLLLLLLWWRGRPARQRAKAERLRAEAEHLRAVASMERAHRAGRRTSTWPTRVMDLGMKTGPNALLLLLLMAPAADRLPLIM